MPNASALAPIFSAVAAVLVGDATLLSLVGGPGNIMGFEPESRPSKYIVVGNSTEESWNTLGGRASGFGSDTTITVHIYSDYKGDQEALQILGRVTTLLNFAEFAVDGYPTFICEYGDKMTRVLIDTTDRQERRHIPAVFSIKVHD